MSRIAYADSDKSKNFSTDDYTTLSDYNHSFFSAVRTSQLRMAMAPGTVKYFNKIIYGDYPESDKNISLKLAPVVVKPYDGAYGGYKPLDNRDSL